MNSAQRSEKRRSANTEASSDIEFVEEIGRGSYGEVFRALWQGRRVAAKRIHSIYFGDDYDNDIREHYIEEFKKEWEVLRKVNHPNIVRMITVLFPSERSPIIVTELLHCDLKDYIKNSTTKPKVLYSELLDIGLGVGKGLAYLHGLDSPIVHRDLACKNILLTVDKHAKIADLGVAKVFSAGKDMSATAVPGTPLYAAPETYPALAGPKVGRPPIYGVKVDIFSFGVVLLVMIVGREPNVWPLSPITPDGKRVDECHRRKKDISEMSANHPLRGTILQCLQNDSSRRPTAEEIVRELRARNSNPLRLADDTDADSDLPLEKVGRQPFYDYEFKVLLIGDMGVGKSCLLRRFQNPHYNVMMTTSTVGVEIDNEVFKYGSKFVHMQVVDTAGQEQFFSVQAMYFRAVHGIFLVCDVTRPETFQSLSRWIEQARKYCTESNAQMLVVGNKMDQVKDRKILFEDCRKYAEDNGLPYMETSAFDVDSIEHMYRKMIQALSRSIDIGAIRLDIDTQKDKVALQPAKKASKCRCRRS